jgi:hypothetical protein
MHAATQRYLAWLSRLEDRSSGKVDLDKLSRPVKDGQARSWRGFNVFLNVDLQGILAVLAGEHQISGLTSRRLQRLLPDWTRSRIARLYRGGNKRRLLRVQKETVDLPMVSVPGSRG